MPITTFNSVTESDGCDTTGSLDHWVTGKPKRSAPSVRCLRNTPRHGRRTTRIRLQSSAAEAVGLLRDRPSAESIVKSMAAHAAGLLRNGSELKFTSPS
jgi:hypothetical protein